MNFVSILNSSANMLTKVFPLLDENLLYFKGVRNKTGLHLMSSDESRGYTLIGFTDKLDCFYDDYKTRMEEARDLYSSLFVDIIRKFVDYEKRLLGFSWRKI